MEWRIRQNCPYSPKNLGGSDACEAFDKECFNCISGPEANIQCNIYRQLASNKIKHWTVESFIGK